VLAFGVTAALAVTLNRPAPMNAALITASQSQPAPRCTAPALAISLVPGGVSAGTEISRVEFTNTSTAVCTLSGYPVVEAYIPSATAVAQVGAVAVKDASAGARPVLLRPGASAHSDIAIDLTLPVAACEPVVATGLLITAPGESSPRYLRVRLTGCSATGPTASGYLRVEAVMPGTGVVASPD